MKIISRLLVILFFFIPLFASCFFLIIEFSNASWSLDFLNKFWTPYVINSFKVTFFIGISSVLIATILVYFVGFSIFTLRDKKIERFLSLFLSVPHLAFMTGVFFLVSSTGFLIRILMAITPNDFSSFYGFDRDTYGLTLAISLGIKESLFLLFISIPKIYETKLNKENTISESFGHTAFTSWTYVIWPQVLQSLRYSIWIVLAYSVSVVDLSIVIGPTNPPPFSVVLWEFFQNPSEKSQLKSLLGSAVIIFELGLVVFFWEFLLKILKYFKDLSLAWKINYRFSLSPYLVIFLYGFIQLMPVLILVMWGVSDRWNFPFPLPESYNFNNIVAIFIQNQDSLRSTVELGFFSSLISIIVCLLWFEWDKNSFSPLVTFSVLFIPIFPLLPLLFGLQIYMEKLFFLNRFFLVLLAHIFLIFPYIFLILKNNFQEFDPRYKLISQSLGKKTYQFFFKVRLPLILKGILTAFSIGFAISIAQFLSTVLIGAGRVETITTEMIVAVASERRKLMAVYGLMQMMLPLVIFLLPTFMDKKD